MLGHLTFASLPDRGLLACYHSVYAYISAHYREQAALWELASQVSGDGIADCRPPYLLPRDDLQMAGIVVARASLDAILSEKWAVDIEEAGTLTDPSPEGRS